MASSYSTQNQHSETHSQTHSSTRGGSDTRGGSQSITRATGQVDPTIGFGYWATAQGYNQSQQVKDAYNKLQNTLNNAPGAFSSNYTQSLNNLYNQIMNRPGFQYNMNNDALYGAYKDQYVAQGKQAMKDTIAQGAALTGGYQNSYANTAGNQAYQTYLQRLNEIVPTLQQNAYAMYQDETSQLYNKANLTRDLYNQDYQQYRDRKSDYYADRDYFTNFYNNERNFDYGKFRDDRNYYASEYWNQRNAEKTTDTSNWSHTDTWSDTDSNTDSYTDSQSSTSSYTESGGSSSSGSKSKGGSSYDLDDRQLTKYAGYEIDGEKERNGVDQVKYALQGVKKGDWGNTLYSWIGKQPFGKDYGTFTTGDYAHMLRELGIG